MKILRIIARLNVGGPARHVVWLSEGLQSEGYETLLVAGVVPPGEEDMSYVAAGSGITPVIVPEMSREISWRDALTIWKIFRLMLRERPDIVHTHTAKAGAVGRAAGFFYRWLTPSTLIGKPRRCQFVHTYHGHVFHSYYGKLKSRIFLSIERLLAKLVTDRIVVVSRQQRDEINGTFRVGRPAQFAIIPLGIELDVYENWQSRRPLMREELKAREDELLVGIVGRLTEVKNHRMFFESAARFRALTGDQARFVVVGDGKLRRELEAQIAGLQLSGVVFAGPRRDPENFYPALDVVALTSQNEGTPLTLIEAMANARPVIATDAGGVIDLLGSPRDIQSGFTICERGVLAKRGDAEGFARGLKHLLADETLRLKLGRAGFDFVRQNHSKQRLLDDISRLYRELAQIPAVEFADHPAEKPVASRVPGR